MSKNSEKKCYPMEMALTSPHRRGRKPALSESQQQEVYALFSSGATSQELAEKYGVSQGTIYATLHKVQNGMPQGVKQDLPPNRFESGKESA